MIAQICNKYFVSKKGMLQNNSIKKMMEKYDMKILSNIFIFGFQKNLTFHSLYDPDFQEFLFCLNKEFELPAEATLMRFT